MKYLNIIPYLLIAVSFILTGCPVSSEYPLIEKSNAAAADTRLIGIWHNSNSEAVAQKITVKKGSIKNTYSVS